MKKSLMLILSLVFSVIASAANPAQPFLPSDNIQDPNCVPSDSNCYVTTMTGTIIDGGNSTGNTLTIGTNDSQALQFETDGLTRLTVLANGNVGIGTASPVARLMISADTVASTTDLLSLTSSSGSTRYLLVGSNGKVAIGTATVASTNSQFVVASQMSIGSNGTSDGIDGGIWFGALGGNATGESIASKRTAGVGQFGINLNTGYTTRLHVSSGGNIGIGTSSPAQILHIKAVTSGQALLVEGATGGYANIDIRGDRTSGNLGGWRAFRSGDTSSFFEINPLADRSGTVFNTGNGSTAATSKMIFTQAGFLGIGTTTPADMLQVFGDIRVGTTGTNGCVKDFSGTVITGTCSSDERLKTNVTDLTDGYLDKMVRLKTVTYNWNSVAQDINKVDTSVTNYGLLAQNVESVFPELVTTDSNGYKQVNYSRLPLYLLKSLQELAVKVSSLFDGTGKIKSKEITVEKMCIEEVCITKDQLKAILQTAGTNQVVHINTAPTTPDPVIEVPATTTDPVVDAPATTTEETSQ